MFKKEPESSDSNILHKELNIDGVKRKKKCETKCRRNERATETLRKTRYMERFLRNETLTILYADWARALV